MRILQIAPPWFTVPPSGYGGIERVVVQLTDSLVDAGHEVTLLASGGSRTKAELWSVFDVPPSRALGDPAHEITHWMRAYASRFAFDVIHDHSSIVGAALAAVAGGPPVVHTVHGAWEPHIAAAYRALPRGLHIVAISKDHARRAPAGVAVADIVHNGIDPERFPFTAEPRTDAPYLAFVGRASPDKGPDVAIRVAGRLGRRLRMALKVNEPGECDYFERQLRPLLAYHDVDLVLNGSAGQSTEMLANADAVLAPLAWDEPFGLVLAEAMATGTPVVAFERGAASEIIADGVTGFLVRPGDLDGMCDAVIACKAVSRRDCRDRVERLFSTAVMVNRYEALYERVTSRREPQLRRMARRMLAGVRL